MAVLQRSFFTLATAVISAKTVEGLVTFVQTPSVLSCSRTTPELFCWLFTLFEHFSSHVFRLWLELDSWRGLVLFLVYSLFNQVVTLQKAFWYRFWPTAAYSIVSEG